MLKYFLENRQKHKHTYKKYNIWNREIYVNVLICGVLSFLLNITAKYYINSNAKMQQEIVESVYFKILQSIIEEELNPAIIPGYESFTKEKKTEYIRDYFNNRVFFSKSFINDSNGLGFSPTFTIQDLFEKITDNTIFYTVIDNNQKILSNNFYIKLQDDPKVLKNQLILGVKLNNESPVRSEYIKQNRIHHIISNVTCLLIFVMLSIAVIIRGKRDINLRKKIEDLENALSSESKAKQEIILFNNLNKKYITECYDKLKEILNRSTNFPGSEIFKEKEDFFPLSLFSLAQEENTECTIDLQPLNDLLIKYFKGYKAYFGVLVELEIELAQTKSYMPFNKNLFYQIIISLFFNILYFNKDTNNKRYVKLIFNEDKIICLSNGFFLEKNMAIKYSKKILYETGNIFLLNLGQIFEILDRFNLHYSVVLDKENTRIELNFKESNKKESNDGSTLDTNSKKIISINKFKQKKTL